MKTLAAACRQARTLCGDCKTLLKCRLALLLRPRSDSQHVTSMLTVRPAAGWQPCFRILRCYLRCLRDRQEKAEEQQQCAAPLSFFQSDLKEILQHGEL